MTFTITDSFIAEHNQPVEGPLREDYAHLGRQLALVRAYVQAHRVDRAALAERQQRHDALLALQTLRQAFTTDIAPILAMARLRSGGAIDPVATFRASGCRSRKDKERPAVARQGAGIV